MDLSRARRWVVMGLLGAVGCHHGSTNGFGGKDGGTDTQPGGSDLAGLDQAGPSPSALPFRHGINLGYQTSAISDATSAMAAHTAGADSIRVKLTEPYLDQWGDDVAVGNMMSYATTGMSDHVSMTIGMADGHSQAPQGSSDYDRETIAPKNLYEPIFLGDGSVNPDNYWAAFVERSVKTYSPWVRTWEVWNEPDQVGGNYAATQTWSTTAPAAKDLVWWQDSIYAYVRLLRVTSAVVKKYDPTAKVALGGIGYPTFLAALLRYTDEPNAGAVDADHPFKAEAYFDVVSFHYYPMYTPGSSDAGAAALVAQHDDMQAALDAAGVPGKTFICTESGASRYALGTSPGGERYARNYLWKAMALGHAAGVQRIDWFILGDGAVPGASQDPYQYTGLYLNYANATQLSDLVMTPTGTAYSTLGTRLAAATVDATATAALASTVGQNVREVVYTTAAGKRAYVAWATSTGAGENATGTATLPATGNATVYAWDGSMTSAAPTSGIITIPVTSSPVLVVVG